MNKSIHQFFSFNRGGTWLQAVLVLWRWRLSRDIRLRHRQGRICRPRSKNERMPSGVEHFGHHSWCHRCCSGRWLCPPAPLEAVHNYPRSQRIRSIWKRTPNGQVGYGNDSHLYLKSTQYTHYWNSSIKHNSLVMMNIYVDFWSDFDPIEQFSRFWY